MFKKKTTKKTYFKKDHKENILNILGSQIKNTQAGLQKDQEIHKPDVFVKLTLN